MNVRTQLVSLNGAPVVDPEGPHGQLQRLTLEYAAAVLPLLGVQTVQILQTPGISNVPATSVVYATLPGSEGTVYADERSELMRPIAALLTRVGVTELVVEPDDEDSRTLLRTWTVLRQLRQPADIDVNDPRITIPEPETPGAQ